MNAADLVPIPVYYDFASALCWVAHRVVDRMQGAFEGLGLEPRWRPVDLTRLSGWRRGRPIEGVSRQNALRVSEELEVPLRLPGYWIDSRAASAVALGLTSCVHVLRCHVAQRLVDSSVIIVLHKPGNGPL